MACCMLGAMFLGQCLAVWALIKRWLGFADSTERKQRGILAASRFSPRVVVVVVFFELLLGGMGLAYSGNEVHEHASHSSEIGERLVKLERSTVCGLADRALQKNVGKPGIAKVDVGARHSL